MPKHQALVYDILSPGARKARLALECVPCPQALYKGILIFITYNQLNYYETYWLCQNRTYAINIYKCSFIQHYISKIKFTPFMFAHTHTHTPQCFRCLSIGQEW